MAAEQWQVVYRWRDRAGQVHQRVDGPHPFARAEGRRDELQHNGDEAWIARCRGGAS